jgi:hypothetical protein
MALIWTLFGKTSEDGWESWRLRLFLFSSFLSRFLLSLAYCALLSWLFLMVTSFDHGWDFWFSASPLLYP